MKKDQNKNIKLQEVKLDGDAAFSEHPRSTTPFINVNESYAPKQAAPVVQQPLSSNSSTQGNILQQFLNDILKKNSGSK